MNETILSVEKESIAVRVAEGTVFVAITLLIVAGNSLCIFVLRRARRLNDVTRVLLISLTAADLLMGLVVAAPILGTVIADGWPYGYAFCAISASGNQICATTSLFSLLLINAERYICISRPMRYPSLVTVRRARLAVICVWILGLVLGLSNCFLPGRIAMYHKNFHSCFFNPTTNGQPDLMGILCAILFVFAPFPVLIIMYTRLFLIARRHAHLLDARSSACEHRQRPSFPTEESDSPSGAPNQLNSPPVRRMSFFPEFKAAKTFGIITLTYALAWMPFFSLVIYENLTLTPAPRGATVTAACMALSNSWFNVLVYYYRNQVFRKSAKETLLNFRGESLYDYS